MTDEELKDASANANRIIDETYRMGWWIGFFSGVVACVCVVYLLSIWR